MRAFGYRAVGLQFQKQAAVMFFLLLFFPACTSKADKDLSEVPSPLKLDSQAGAESVVFVTDLGPDPSVDGETSPQEGRSIDGEFPAGLWAVRTDGSIQPVLDRAWYPIAATRQGTSAALPRGDSTERQNYDYVIVEGKKVQTLEGSASKLACGRWSSDGSQLVYLAASGIADREFRTGTLWLTGASSESRPERLARGVFSDCPVWSSSGRTLAYTVESDEQNQGWQLKVKEVSGAESTFTMSPVETLGAPSTNRRFDWTPAGHLIFLNGLSFSRVLSGKAEPFGAPNALKQIESRLSQTTTARTISLRVSPDGQLFAVGIGYHTGIFRADGSLVRIVDTLFRGWIGSRAILGVPADSPFQTWLTRYEVDSDSHNRLEEGFKRRVVSDPKGQWAVHSSRESRALVFRRPDGSSLSEVPLDFRPEVVQVLSSDGRSATSPWP